MTGLLITLIPLFCKTVARRLEFKVEISLRPLPIISSSSMTNSGSFATYPLDGPLYVSTGKSRPLEKISLQFLGDICTETTSPFTLMPAG